MLRHLSFLIIWGCTSQIAIAQTKFPSKRLDRIAASFMEKYPDDSLRALKLYLWVHKKLKYDFKSYRKLRFPSYNSNPVKVLRKGKALCSGFSILYEDICRRSKISCIPLSGYTHQTYPGTPTYYPTHAWNTVKINNRWLYCDVTADNGYMVVRKNAPIYIIKRLLKIPFLYTKFKYKEKSQHRSWAIAPKFLIKYLHPTLYNAQNMDTSISIKSFEEQRFDISDSPQLRPDYHPQNLDTYYHETDKGRMLLEINEVRKLNPYDHLTLLCNYHNYLVEDCSSKDTSVRHFGCIGNVFIDSGLVNGRLFLRDNRTLNQYNRQYINKENQILTIGIRKIKSHNNGLRGSSRRKYYQYSRTLSAMKAIGDRGTLSYEKKYDTRYRIRISKKTPKPTLIQQLEANYKYNEKLIDSLNDQYQIQYQRLGNHPDSIRRKMDTLQNLGLQRYNYDAKVYELEKGFALSKFILPYALQPADSLTQLQKEINQAIAHYEKVTFRNFHNSCIVLNGKIFNLYMSNFKIKLQLGKQDSTSKADAGLQQAIARSQDLYKKLYEFRDDFKDHNDRMHAMMNKEAKLLHKMIILRRKVHTRRCLMEQYRLRSYNLLANEIISDLKYWKRLRKPIKKRRK